MKRSKKTKRRENPYGIRKTMKKRMKKVRHLKTVLDLSIRVLNASDKKTIYRK